MDRPRLEDELPTYGAATSRCGLLLVARRVRSQDLFNASLVNKRWHGAFTREIWTRADQLWEMGDLPALTRFLLFLRTLSKSPRVYGTRNLSLLSVHPSIYTRLPPNWLQTLLKKLPSLDSLSLRALPFFDHVSLNAVSCTHTLTTLLATECTNATPQSLYHLLSRLSGLSRLDLSGTPSASHPRVLSAISALTLLNTLALRELSLSDGVFSPIVRQLGTSLHSLDVGGNALTEATVCTLLDYSFAPPSYPYSEYAPRGITHLRISDNALNATAVQQLLKTSRLRTLDVGAAPHTGVASAWVSYAQDLRAIRVHWLVAADEAFRPRGLHADTVVLVHVPLFAPAAVARSLVDMLDKFADSAVQVIEMEVVDLGSAAGFSFFSGGEEEGGSRWEDGEVDVLAEIAKRRRGTGGWRGVLRVVRDLGGRESRERGLGGERWGVIRERV